MKRAIHFIAVLWLAPLARAEDWPQFRGPGGQGVSAEKGLPLEWSSAAGIAWTTPLPGEGWSSPIVHGDRLYVTSTTDDGKRAHVIALDRAGGHVLWDTTVLELTPRHKNEKNSFATPTPVADGELVCAAFGDGSFVALRHDGTIAWTNRDFPFYSQHGLGTSPILWDDLLIMARDGSSDGDDKKLGWQTPWDRGFVLALERKSGKVRWKTGRGSSRIAHVTPAVWTAPDGRAQVVSGAGDVVQGFDAKTGARLWSAGSTGEGVVPSIVLGGGLAFAASGWGGRESIVALRLDGTGERRGTTVAWEQRKGMPHIPSFVHASPHLFTITEGGVAACLRADTGGIVAQKRIDGSFSASPVLADGRLYLLDEEGTTTVLEAGPELEVLATNRLGDKCQASMAVAGGRLFIRTEKSLHAIGKP